MPLVIADEFLPIIEQRERDAAAVARESEHAILQNALSTGNGWDKLADGRTKPLIEQREREARAQGACDTSQLLFDVANAGVDEWSRKPLGLLDFIRRHNDDTHAELAKLKSQPKEV